eukprot:m.84052 g.84052  ORF g.84052 m.84052 type:complete len:933 (-) comp13464_c0_seq1:29-2827(-)
MAEFSAMHGIGVVPERDAAAPAGYSPNRALEMQNLNGPTLGAPLMLNTSSPLDEGLGPRKATMLYGNTARKYELAGELKMSSGLSIDYIFVHRIQASEEKQKEVEDLATKRKEMFAQRKRERKGPLTKQERKAIEHPDEEKERLISRTMKRYAFEEAMRGKGLDLEQELGCDPTLVFTKVHVPFHLLCEQAEAVKLNMKLCETEQEERNKEIGIASKMKKGLSQTYKRFMERFNVFASGEPDPVDFFSAPFTIELAHLFENSKDEKAFFNDAQRATLTYHLLISIRYGPKSDQVGLRKLLNNGAYLAAYPLHDGPVPKSDDMTAPENMTHRGKLYQKWARIGVFYKQQPLELIRTYFGERIGIYFAWLGFYTSWLILPAIVGFIIFLYGLGSFANQQDAKELCDTTNRILMCPACDECETWYLDTVCTPYRFSWTFDNPATIFFAIFMSIWASVFLDFWRRRNAKLAYEWDVRNLSLEEPDRPQFKAKGFDKDGNPLLRLNPITKREEKDYPHAKRAMKYTATGAVVLVTLAVVIMVAISIIVYRLAVRIALFRSSSSGVKGQSAIIASFTAALLNLLAITILNMLYVKLAVRMTDWENHRKDSKYESHLAFKMFVFSFVNTYSSLFYVAYFKGQFNGYPGNYSSFFGMRPDECPDYGCLLELTIQLSVIMVGKQIIGNVTEFIIPRVMKWYNDRKASNELKKSTLLPWEEQYKLGVWPERDMFYEYLEMIIQFGFITLFVASFPLSPLFAFLNNVFEIRIDADKMVTGLRRPPAHAAANIGIWEYVLEVVSFLSVITNGLVIAVTSTYLTKVVYAYAYDWNMYGYVAKTHPFFNASNCSYTTLRDGNGDKGLFFYQVWAARLAFLILFEHFVFMAKFTAQGLIPNIPKTIRLKIEREEFLAQEALAHKFAQDDRDHAAAVLATQPSVNSLA